MELCEKAVPLSGARAYRPDVTSMRRLKPLKLKGKLWLNRGADACERVGRGQPIAAITIDLGAVALIIASGSGRSAGLAG